MIRYLRRFLHHFNYDVPISRKLHAITLLLILLPTIAVTALLYGQINQLIVTVTIESEKKVSEQTVNTIDTNIQTVKNVSGILANDSYMREIVKHPAFSHISHVKNPEQLTDSFVNSIESCIDGTLIKDIRIYLDTPYDDLYKGSSDHNFFQSMENVRGIYWSGIMGAVSDNTLFCPSFYLSQHEIREYADLAYVKRIRYAGTGYDEATAAYLVIYFSSDPLTLALMPSEDQSQAVNYIVNERENIVVSSNRKLSAMYFMNHTNLDRLIGKEDTFVRRHVLGRQVYTSYYSIEGTDWKLVSIIPASPLMRHGQIMIMEYIGIYALALIIALGISGFISRSISERLENVVHKMERTHHTKVHKLKDAEGMDEIGDFVITYNHMADQINQLIERQTEAAEKLKTSEFNALQAQINPHFLYNTLDMINWMALEGETDKVSDAIRSLSKFYKLTLSRKNTIDSIERELEHVSLYVKLQNMRFSDRIEFIADVPDTLMDYEIPKLTFQPIVENAILHGIFEKEDKSGTIVITAWEEDGDIVFLISDDGVGMDKDTCEHLLDDRKIFIPKNKGSSIGIYNTHQRLKLLYGKSYGLHYESTLGEGTEVTVRIPAIRL